MTGTTLQEDIARSTRRFQQLALDILQHLNAQISPVNSRATGFACHVLNVAAMTDRITAAADISDGLRGDDIDELWRRCTLSDQGMTEQDRADIMASRERSAVIALRGMFVRTKPPER